LLLIGLVGCNWGEVDLSDAIAFEGAAECRLAPKTLRIFGSMIDEASGAPRQGTPVEIAGLGTIQPTFLGPDEGGMVHAQLPLKGNWHGLTIKGLGRGFVPNSGVSYTRILFKEPPKTARERLNRVGFNLPPGGEAREFGDGMAEYISVADDGRGSALECTT
jgi:hypothetical protein